MLISELRGVAGNVPDVYRAFGIEPADYKMAVLKTASNFQYFAPITSRVIRVDTRGPGQSDVFTLAVAAHSAPDLSRSIRSTDWRDAPQGQRGRVRRERSTSRDRTRIQHRAGGTVT